MKLGAFDTLPPLTKEEAFSILETPIDGLQRSSDYYKAVFHLAKYPCLETEEVLLSFIEKECEDQSIQIAKRKAIEVLAVIGCTRAIPFIGTNLNSNDPYLIDSCAWALKELCCKDKQMHRLIGDLLLDEKQNQRGLVQSLSKMGAIEQTPRIIKLLNDPNSSPAVIGASIAAVNELIGDSSKVEQLKDFLRLPNQNDRQCAVQDIIDTKAIDLLPEVIESPISPYFKLRAIDSLWSRTCANVIDNELNLFELIEEILLDNPSNIKVLKNCKESNSLKDLTNQLFSTDFNLAYIALLNLLNEGLANVFPILEDLWDKFMKDYGAIYFLTLLFRDVEQLNDLQKKKVVEFLFSCIQGDWPLNMKFRSSAIISLMRIDHYTCKDHLSQWLSPKFNPYWPCRYATLMSIASLDFKNQDVNLLDQVSSCINDPHRFIRIKAKKLYSNMRN